MWLARSERGGLCVIRTQGYQYDIVSTPAIEYAINSYDTVSDAFAYIYAEEGHQFYVLTFPTADVTWVYDLRTDYWHQRASFNADTGDFHRQRVNCMVSLAGMQVGGDFENGRIYWQSRDFYADDQYPLVALRRAPHIWDKNDRNRVINSRLQIDFFPGVGLVSGQGSDPQAMLRWSNDGGQTWGNEHFASLGKIGETKKPRDLEKAWDRSGSGLRGAGFRPCETRHRRGITSSNGDWRMSTVAIPRTRFIDPGTGDISKEWRYFLTNLVGMADGSTADSFWELLPPGSDVTPQADDVSPPSVVQFGSYDDLTPTGVPCLPPDDVSALIARVEALQAQVQQLTTQIDGLKQGITA